jgi:hypothetical protein
MDSSSDADLRSSSGGSGGREEGSAGGGSGGSDLARFTRLEFAALNDTMGDFRNTGLGSTLEHEDSAQGSEKAASEPDRVPGLLGEETVERLLMLRVRSRSWASGEGRRRRGGGFLDLKPSLSDSWLEAFKLSWDMLLLKLLTRSKAAPRAGD